MPLKLTPQETQVLEFLAGKTTVYWEELVKFCKHPSSVKLKTVKKIVSDIKKKYTEHSLAVPFNCTFNLMPIIKEPPKMFSTTNTVEFNGQTLVQVKLNKKPIPEPTVQSTAQILINKFTSQTSDDKEPVIDFVLKPYTRQIITRSGMYSLNSDEFDICSYFSLNRGRFISLEELRDKVCYPKFGSKTPARWFFSIQRRISNIRQQIPETKNRLMTVKQANNSGYIFN